MRSIKQGPKHDPQRYRVYAMENLLGTLGRSKLSRRHCYLALRKWSEAFDVPQPKLVFRQFKKHAGEQQGEVVRLSTSKFDGRCPLTVAHEFAHYLVSLYDPDDRLQPHGPEFVGVLMCVLELTGIVPRPGMKYLAERVGVEYVNVDSISTPRGVLNMIRHYAARKKNEPS